jgi:hypothetical protein
MSSTMIMAVVAGVLLILYLMRRRNRMSKED